MFVVPFAPGGGTDAFARPMAAQLDTQLGQRILIENKAGAGGTLGASYAAKQPADGYTFLIAATHHTIAPSIYPKLDYDIEKDFVPVIMLARPPHVVSVHPGKIQATTLKDFIAYAKANQVNYASAGAGTTHHLAGEFFNIQAGVKLNHVPYRGAAPAVIDTVAGHVSLLFAAYGSVSGQMQSGKLKALAVTSAKRISAAPQLPTVAEAALPGFDSTQWWGAYGPAGMNADIVNRLNRELNVILATADMRKRLSADGADPAGGTPADLAAHHKADFERWQKVIRDAGIKGE